MPILLALAADLLDAAKNAHLFGQLNPPFVPRGLVHVRFPNPISALLKSLFGVSISLQLQEGVTSPVVDLEEAVLTLV